MLCFTKTLYILVFLFYPIMTPETSSIRMNAAAKDIGVSASTLRKWVDSGLMESMRLPSGERRVTSDGIEHMKSFMKMKFCPRCEMYYRLQTVNGGIVKTPDNCNDSSDNVTIGFTDDELTNIKKNHRELCIHCKTTVNSR